MVVVTVCARMNVYRFTRLASRAYLFIFIMCAVGCMRYVCVCVCLDTDPIE